MVLCFCSEQASIGGPERLIDLPLVPLLTPNLWGERKGRGAARVPPVLLSAVVVFVTCIVLCIDFF